MRGKENWLGNELGKTDIINMNTVNARVGLIEGSMWSKWKSSKSWHLLFVEGWYGKDVEDIYSEMGEICRRAIHGRDICGGEIYVEEIYIICMR